MKYGVSVSKKVQTLPYENVEVGYWVEYDSNDVPPDVAEAEVSKQVDEWINIELRMLGLRERSGNKR